MEEIWILFVMFAHIVSYDNPSPKYVEFKTGPEYSSSKECLNESSEWIIQEIKKMDFGYDWKLAVCSNGEIDVYKHPVTFNEELKGVQINYNALLNGNSMYKSGTYKTSLRKTNF